MKGARAAARGLVFPCRAAVLLLLLVAPPPAHAFYQWEGEDSALEATGLLHGSATMLRNPDSPFYYSDRNVAAVAGSARGMLSGRTGSHLSFETHAVLTYVPRQLQTGGSRFVSTRGTERSDSLDWSYDSRQSHLQIDRLNAQYTSSRLNIKVGRQPVNLAATFYFTPNDFFSPFAAQTFYRTYKPGVDAARIDIQSELLSQISLLAVLGYRAETANDAGWSNRPDAGRTSYLARASTVFADFELAVLGGVVRRDRVIGGDLQGELFDWLGIRAEGHFLFPDNARQNDHGELAVGLEHRWESSLSIRVEQFFHGSGAAGIGGYSLLASGRGFYQARHYSAAGASYEFTPLLTGDMAAIYNWVDRSLLLAVYAVYSLSDESEAVFNANLPVGSRSGGAIINSEFGLYPNSFSLELRSYF